ncbi:MAG TPA: hypothetical protein VGQ12_04150 [Candidatus Angelobacter sp.]|jgi:hypothetical protein|nr:hypothetical protein [Candidatus Angelobacter sp.]
MPANHVLSEFADELIENAMQRLSIMLPHYDKSLLDGFSDERKSLIDRANQLDDALQSLIQRCAAARESEPLVIEMRKLRIRGLQFFLFLRASKRLLRTITRRLAANARISGYDAEINMLRTEISFAETDSKLFEADELFRINPELFKRKWKPLSRINELNVFLRACLLPIKAIRNKRPFEQVGRMYAKAIAGLIYSSTKKIYKEQFYSLAIVLWRVVQPTLAPLIAGFAVVYLIHAGLEVAGVQFLHLSLSVFFAIVIAYLCEKGFEHFFEHWHLLRYRKKCVHTALALYLAEIRARVSLMGLLRLSEATPIETTKSNL